uniref:Uncharacterized protein n=1 Tax=Rhizophora mucronata TaxID=61149 RepID=A0A2P2KAD3_RHIMU
MAFLCFPSPLWNTPRPAFMPPITGSVPPVPKSIRFRNWVLDFHSKSSNFMLSGALALCLSFSGRYLYGRNNACLISLLPLSK